MPRRNPLWTASQDPQTPSFLYLSAGDPDWTRLRALLSVPAFALHQAKGSDRIDVPFAAFRPGAGRLDLVLPDATVALGKTAVELFYWSLIRFQTPGVEFPLKARQKGNIAGYLRCLPATAVEGRYGVAIASVWAFSVAEPFTSPPGQEAEDTLSHLLELLHNVSALAQDLAEVWVVWMHTPWRSAMLLQEYAETEPAKWGDLTTEESRLNWARWWEYTHTYLLGAASDFIRRRGGWGEERLGEPRPGGPYGGGQRRRKPPARRVRESRAIDEVSAAYQRALEAAEGEYRDVLLSHEAMPEARLREENE